MKINPSSFELRQIFCCSAEILTNINTKSGVATLVTWSYGSKGLGLVCRENLKAFRDVSWSWQSEWVDPVGSQKTKMLIELWVANIMVMSF